MPTADWSTFFAGGHEAYADPKKPGCRLASLRMSDGDVLFSVEVFHATHPDLLAEYGHFGVSPTTRVAWHLGVSGDTPESAVWIYEGPHYEKNMQAVVANAGDEAVCQRVAETLRRIDGSAEKLAALLISGPDFAAFPPTA
jgi:hypothetical protein